MEITKIEEDWNASLSENTSFLFTRSFNGTSSANIPEEIAMVVISTALISCVGNVVILSLICGSKKFRRPVNYMVANLAMVSIIRLICITLRYMMRGGWMQISSQIICKIFALLYHVAFPVEGFALAYIGIERSRAVRNPWKRYTVQDAKWQVVYVWTAALLIQLPHLVFWEIESDSGGVYKCVNVRILWGNNYTWLTFLILYLVVAVIGPSLFQIREILLLMAYLRFLKVPSVAQVNENDVKCCRRLTDNHARLIRNSIVYTALFIALYFPVGVWYTVYQMRREDHSKNMNSSLTGGNYFLLAVGMLYYTFYPLLVFLLRRNFKPSCSRGDNQQI